MSSPAYGMKARWASSFVIRSVFIAMRAELLRRGPVTKRSKFRHMLPTEKGKAKQ